MSQAISANGTAALSKEGTSSLLTVDISKMPGAADSALEISKANVQFAVKNGFESAGPEVSSTVKSNGNGGNYQLRRGMFPTSGIYQVRAYALDKTGQRIGCASDHFLFRL